MASLTELAQFVDQILRLDTDMPVKGYDGFTIGNANEQAQALANRTLWLKENLASLEAIVDALAQRQIVLSVNKKTGNITLNYNDVGAAPLSHGHTAADITPTTERAFVSPSDKKNWDGKQNKLVSGTDIKTLFSESLLGSGNIEIAAKDITTDESFQFISAVERTKWNNKQNVLVNGKDISTLHGHNLLGGGDLTLTASEVGADPSGTAAQEVDAHEQKTDPHPQYLNIERGDERYVEETLANQPNGYLRLDEKGQIPTSIAKLFEVRYLTVGNAEERFAIERSNNITICLQTDENRIYYLDANADPSVEDNWHSGRDADPSAVISVFGRSGIITAEKGDYQTDDITETANRVFVTPTQKTTWSGKQDALVSGKTIRTINGTSLLGSGDVEINVDTLEAAKRAHTHNVEDIKTSDEKQFVSENDKFRWDAKQVALENGKNIKTLNGEGLLGDGNIDISPTSIKAANEEHTHVPDDILTNENAEFVTANQKVEWTAKQDKLESGKNLATVFGHDLLKSTDIELQDIDDLALGVSTLLEPGNGIKIEYNDISDKIVITNTLPNITAGSDITVIYAENSKKGTDYSYTIGNKMGFDFSAYALKEKIISESKSTTYTYNDSIIKTLPQTALPNFDEYDVALVEASKSIAIDQEETYATETYYCSEEIDLTDLEGIGFSESIEDKTMIIPAFTGANGDSDTGKEINGFKPFSSRIYPNYQAWKAFQGPIVTWGSNYTLAAEKYWSDIQLWRYVSDEVYLGISAESAKRVTGYAFQTIGSYYMNTSTLITAWTFQGRNSDSDSWVTLDTQKGQTLVGTGEWKYYVLPNPVEYKQYRIAPTDVAQPSSTRPSIARLQLFSSPYMLIKGNDEKWYTLSSEKELQQLDSVDKDTFANKGFQKTFGKVDTETLSAIAPFKLYATESVTTRVDRYKASPQIVIHTALEKTELWYVINSLSAALKSDVDNDRIFVAVTVEGNKWYGLKNNTWNRIKSVSNDASGAEAVIQQGMTLGQLTSVTKSQWAVLLNSVDNNATLGIAFASMMTYSSDSRIPNSITAQFDRLSHWVMTSTSEVGISLTSRQIIFTPTVSASYRFCYKFN